MASLTKPPPAVLTEPAVDRATLLSRRRFVRRQWRRRWLAWKYVAALVLVAGLLAGGVHLVWFSDVLDVEGVRVEGVEGLSTAQVTAVARVPEGTPLVRVDLSEVERRVESLAAVRDATVLRQWPDRVLVRVQERVPVALVDIAGRARGLDAAGVVFTLPGPAPARLPLIETTPETTADGLAEGAAVVDAMPTEVAALVQHLEVATVDAISLVLRDGRRVLWGSAALSEQKAAILPALLEQPGRTFDVSVPAQPTARP